MNTDEIREHFEDMIDTLPPEYENIIDGYLMMLIFEENITSLNIGSTFSNEVLNFSQDRKIAIVMNLIKSLDIDIEFLTMGYLT